MGVDTGHRFLVSVIAVHAGTRHGRHWARVWLGSVNENNKKSISFSVGDKLLEKLIFYFSFHRYSEISFQLHSMFLIKAKILGFKGDHTMILNPSFHYILINLLINWPVARKDRYWEQRGHSGSSRWQNACCVTLRARKPREPVLVVVDITVGRHGDGHGFKSWLGLGLHWETMT